MPAHPKPVAKAKKPGAMRSAPKKPKGHGAVTPTEREAIEKRVASRKPAEKSPKRPKEPKAAKEPGGQTKGEMIKAMLGTPGGATSKEMEEATGWQPHSVRGFLGTLRKAGVKVISKKLPKEPTIYRIEGAAAVPATDAEVL
jgi:hypothetical protein